MAQLKALNRLAAYVAQKQRRPTQLDREDLTQAAMLAMLAALPRWDPAKGTLMGFLHLVACGAVQTVVAQAGPVPRHLYRRGVRARQLRGLTERLIDPNADQAVNALEAQLDVRTVLDRLPVMDRQMVEQTLGHGLSVETVGRAQGMSYSQAYGAQQRGLRTIRRAVMPGSVWFEKTKSQY